MEYKRYKLGDLITQRREKYEGDDIPIAGISKNGFMPPKQIEADTSIYNVFYLNDFVFNPARMELNSIVFNDVYPKAICSSLYEMFYVHRTDVIMPEYLNLYVKRDEFARHCEFLGSGSAREYCRVANISEIKLDIPSLEEQQKIVRQYKTITDRIEVLEKINETLLTLIKLVYVGIVKGKDGDASTLEDICLFQEGYVNPPQEITEYFDGPIKWLRAGDVNESYIINTERTLTEKGFKSAKKSAILFEPGTIMITKSGVIGRLGIVDDYMCGNRAVINIKPKDRKWFGFIYAFLKDNQEDIINMGTGSAQKNLYVPMLQAIDITKPIDEVLCDFNQKTDPLFKTVKENCNEINLLQNLLAKYKGKKL